MKKGIIGVVVVVAIAVLTWYFVLGKVETKVEVALSTENIRLREEVTLTIYVTNGESDEMGIDHLQFVREDGKRNSVAIASWNEGWKTGTVPVGEKIVVYERPIRVEPGGDEVQRIFSEFGERSFKVICHTKNFGKLESAPVRFHVGL